METIEQYIQSNHSTRIVRRGNSPLIGIVLAVAGIALIVVAFAAYMNSNSQTALLTLGFIATVVGIVLTILCLTRSLWHYVDLKTGQRMHRKSLYLNQTDFNKVMHAAEQGNMPSDLSPVTSSNLQLQVVMGDDLTLVQAGHRDSSQFEPAMPVLELATVQVPAVLKM